MLLFPIQKRAVLLFVAASVVEGLRAVRVVNPDQTIAYVAFVVKVVVNVAVVKQMVVQIQVAHVVQRISNSG